MIMLNLLSFSNAGMGGLLDICWEYSKLWGFFYNQDKCKVLMFNANSAGTTTNLIREKREKKDKSKQKITQTIKQ